VNELISEKELIQFLKSWHIFELYDGSISSFPTKEAILPSVNEKSSLFCFEHLPNAHNILKFHTKQTVNSLFTTLGAISLVSEIDFLTKYVIVEWSRITHIPSMKILSEKLVIPNLSKLLSIQDKKNNLISHLQKMDFLIPNKVLF